MRKRIAVLISSVLVINGNLPFMEMRTEQTPLAADSINSNIVEVKLLSDEFEEKIKIANELKWKNSNTIEYDAYLLEQEEKEKERERLKTIPTYNQYDLTVTSNLSQEQIKMALSGTRLETLDRAFYYYEQKYGVNALFVMALVAEESGWGTSSNSIYMNNLCGYKSRDGGYYYFNDWGECVEELFRMLSEEYLNEDGLFFNGFSIQSVNKLYSENPLWNSNISQIVQDLLNKIN